MKGVTIPVSQIENFLTGLMFGPEEISPKQAKLMLMGCCHLLRLGKIKDATITVSLDDLQQDDIALYELLIGSVMYQLHNPLEEEGEAELVG